MLNRLYSWYGKRVVWGVGVGILILLITGIYIKTLSGTTPKEVVSTVPTVAVSPVRELGSNSSVTLVGTVEAVDEVKLQSEAGGRITSVPVTLGAHVTAGTVIARIENASEYASLLQAEGVYDAAVASAASSDIGVREAGNSAISTYRAAFSNVNDIVLNTIDDLFSDPKDTTPGFKINASGAVTSYLNTERYAFNSLLSEWQKSSATLATSDDLEDALTSARSVVVRVGIFLDTCITALSAGDTGDYFTQSDITTFKSNFASAKSSLNTTLASLDAAKEALSHASISGTGNGVSAADAQIKQALGALRAAQANYAKTIITTPIAGTVNTLDVKAGDYVSISSPVATVANNNALVITTYIDQSEREWISVGDTVTVADTYTGMITNIAPAVDPITGKVEVKISLDADTQIENGMTVSVSFTSKTDEILSEKNIRIGITAFKITPDGPVAFTVGEDNELIAHKVTLGAIQGNTVDVKEGLTPDMVIVTDARGLKEGEKVTLKTQ